MAAISAANSRVDFEANLNLAGLKKVGALNRHPTSPLPCQVKPFKAEIGGKNFSPLIVMKPCLLDPWTALRCAAPDRCRSGVRMCISRSSKDFGNVKVNLENCDPQFVRNFRDHEKQRKRHLFPG